MLRRLGSELPQPQAKTSKLKPVAPSSEDRQAENLRGPSSGQDRRDDRCSPGTPLKGYLCSFRAAKTSRVLREVSLRKFTQRSLSGLHPAKHHPRSHVFPLRIAACCSCVCAKSMARPQQTSSRSSSKRQISKAPACVNLQAAAHCGHACYMIESKTAQARKPRQKQAQA